METTTQTINSNLANAQAIVIKQEDNKNSIGIIGFVLSITSLVLFWVPVLKWLLLIPAMILSLIGLSRKPRKLAIAGVIISFLVFIIILLLRAAFWGGLLGLSML